MFSFMPDAEALFLNEIARCGCLTRCSTGKRTAKKRRFTGDQFHLSVLIVNTFTRK